MKNELGRKITSLTLMTIMLVGGMVIAAPGMMPVAMADHNDTLYVSAENATFDNAFGGAQIVEIVVTDPAINRVDQNSGAPVVKVNGLDVLMAQGADGSWYAYFADTTMVAAADGTGFEFDSLFTQAVSASTIGKALSSTQGFYSTDAFVATALVDSSVGSPLVVGDIENIIAGDSTSWTTAKNIVIRGGTSGAYATALFTDGQSDGFTDTGELTLLSVKKGTFLSSETLYLTMATTSTNTINQLGNVLLSPVPLNEVAAGNLSTGGAVDAGGNGLFQDTWPFVQLYDLTDTTTVTYQKAGPDESVDLAFGSTAGITQFDIDRTLAPQSAQLHVGIGDPQLNIDPTSEDVWFFDNDDGEGHYRTTGATTPTLADTGFDGNGLFTLTTNSVLEIDGSNADTNPTATQTGWFESGTNTSYFNSSDASDDSIIQIASDAPRGTTGTMAYDGTSQSVVVGHFFATLDLDETSIGDEWNSGESITVTLVDEDLNLNTRSNEDLDLNSSTVKLVPSLQIGSPKVLGASTTVEGTATTIDSFSQIARMDSANASPSGTIDILTDTTVAQLRTFAGVTDTDSIYLNYDVRSLLSTTETVVAVTDSSGDVVCTLKDSAGSTITTLGSNNGMTECVMVAAGGSIVEGDTILVSFTATGAIAANDPFVVDFFSFGDSVNNAIYRLELEETGDNTSTFEGLIDYIMLNQLNVDDATSYAGVVPISNEIVIIVHSTLTDEDGPRVNFLDLGADGVSTQIADQQDAPSHSGSVDLDMDTYKIADTVTITLTDMDLNVDSSLIDVYTGVATKGWIGDSDTKLVTVTFNDTEWTRDGDADGSIGGADATDCNDSEIPTASYDVDLQNAGFTLTESAGDSGIFVGTFQVPAVYCQTGESASTTGTDIEVNYVDHRDASGSSIEVGDGAGVRANTGSISLDRTVYPVPWGLHSDFAAITSGKTPNSFSIFPVHASGITSVIDTAAEQIRTTAGDVTIHVRISDPDLDLSAVGEDKMQTDRAGQSVGPIKISISRGTDELTLAYAGGAAASTTKGIVVGTDGSYGARTMGSITEVAGDTGIFELDFTIRYTDGPESSTCPVTSTYTGLDASGSDVGDRFKTTANADATNASGKYFCILQGDILTVEYTDSVDASGNANTVTDSATFDLRNGVLQSDKSVYIIGSDMILTIIEPDWDLENDGAETYDLDVIEWSSDAATVAMGDLGGEDAAFDPEPSAFRETGDSTGIFQIVIEIPESLASDKLERGEEISLEYTDWGPSGAKYVGQEKENMGVTVFTSNFGATVELDQKVYTWTDKVYITIVAPDHNFDGQLVDTIGDTSDDAVKVSTRGYNTDRYSLVETGTDTGIFTGEIILTGFSHDSNGDGTAVRPGVATSSDDSGPTNGFLETSSDDGLTVSFEYSEDATVVGSALIRWNIGEVQWLEASYPASGTGVVRIIDPDMNLNPEAVDNFNVNTWSDSDAGGISLTVTETNEATGIFEGTVFFTTTNESSGHRLRVAEGDTVTSEYEDNTLPDPYTTADELDVSATTLIGTIVPPLERAPAANLRTVDAFGNSLNAVSVDQQVQISADLANGQDKEQAFAYLVQIQDGNGVTVSLAWITGQLSSGQSFSPALSWIPTNAGTYTATAFVWESIDNPTALSPPVSTTISVS